VKESAGTTMADGTWAARVVLIVCSMKRTIKRRRKGTSSPIFLPIRFRHGKNHA